MKKPTVAPIKLSENHRRSISVTLQLVYKALCEWGDWTKGKLRAGVMYYQRDTFSPEQKNELRNKIDRIRQLMTQMRNDLQLKTGVIDTAHSMLGQAGVLWEMLAELNGRALQRGGYRRGAYWRVAKASCKLQARFSPVVGARPCTRAPAKIGSRDRAVVGIPPRYPGQQYGRSVDRLSPRRLHPPRRRAESRFRTLRPGHPAGA